MKIVVMDTAWHGGGAESVAREAYNYFVSKGHECYYAYSRGSVPENVKGIKIGNKLDTYAHVVKSRIFDTNGFESKLATRRFVKKLKELNPDIINIHNIVCYTINIEIFFEYLKSSTAKVIWTQHDCWAFTGHCISFDDVQCEGWKAECDKCPGKKEYPKSLVFSRSKKNVQLKRKIFSGVKNMTLVTPSKWLADILKNTFFSEYNIKVISNGIDVEKFKPIYSDIRNKYEIYDKKIILGVASRWEMRKGLRYFVELYDLIDKEKYKIVLIGIDKKNNKNLPKGILALERTNIVEELIQWYTVADVFVNPTLADNFPTVNLEALACGTPVVTFDTGGSWESVGDECGVLVKEKTSISLYEGIKECIEKSIRKENCIKRANEYKKSDRYDEYLRLFKEKRNTCLK